MNEDTTINPKPREFWINTATNEIRDAEAPLCVKATSHWRQWVYVREVVDEHRIEPKKLECWVNQYPEFQMLPYHVSAYTSREAAERNASAYATSVAIHMVEADD